MGRRKKEGGPQFLASGQKRVKISGNLWSGKGVWQTKQSNTGAEDILVQSQKMKIFNVLISFSILSCLSGCIGLKDQNDSRVTITITSAPGSTVSSLSRTRTPEDAPTQALVAPSPVHPGPLVSPLPPTFTPGPEQFIHQSVIQDCVVIHRKLPQDHKFRGEAIFESTDPQVQNRISLLDLSSGEVLEINGDGRDVTVSPDRTMFAGDDVKTGRLEIFRSDGSEIISHSWKPEWGRLGYWLDNSHLIIVKTEPEKENPNIETYPASLILFDPFTTSAETLPADYPDIDMASIMLDWVGTGTTVYNPRLTHVVYPGPIKNIDRKLSRNGYILFDRVNAVKSAEIPAWNWEDHPPVWSSSGEEILFFGDGGEFYVASIDGGVKKITNLNPQSNGDGDNGVKYTAFYYSWAPNDRLIAFWLKEVESGRLDLAILDPKTGAITNTCIQAGFDLRNVRIAPIPVWSPDSSSVIVAAKPYRNEESSEAILYQIDARQGFLINQNLFPVGWMSLP